MSERRKKLNFEPNINVVREKNKTSAGPIPTDVVKSKVITPAGPEEIEDLPVSLPLGKALYDTGNSSNTDKNEDLSEAEKPCEEKNKGKDQTSSMSDVARIFEGDEKNYILLQFPTVIPITPDEKNKPTPISKVKEGQFGKIHITKSGKARLVVGENELIMETGTTRSFRQDLIVAKIKDDRSSGTLVNMGTVEKSLIMSVDWETLLNKTDKPK